MTCAAFDGLFIKTEKTPTTLKYLTGIHVRSVVITRKHNVITPTIFFQLPVTVQLSLSLNPVAAVCPQSGLGLSYDGSAWGEAGQQLCCEVVSSDRELPMTVNIRGDFQDMTRKLRLTNVSIAGRNRRVKHWNIRFFVAVFLDYYYHSFVAPSHLNVIVQVHDSAKWHFLS